MTEYDNTNRGSLFKNDKGDNLARPDYTGTLNIEGKEYRLAAWIKVSQKTGNKFLSLNVQPKDEASAEAQDTPTTEDAVGDELPF